MKTIKKDVRDAITAQCLEEIRHSRVKKRDVIREWQKNEDIIYERSDNRRAARTLHSRTEGAERGVNVALHKATGFIQTVLSKIDTPLSFKFLAQHEGDQKNARLLNALVDTDTQSDNWNFKDLLGKKHAIIYGRAIFSYFASSTEGYKANLTNIDPYDFLIDPNCGGINLQEARYCGAYNIYFDRSELEEGKSSRFLAREVNEILSGDGNNDEVTQEQQDKSNRYAHLGYTRHTQREKHDPDLFKFWNWYTTYKGERYYVVISETYGKAIRIEKLSDITKSNLFPFWSYAVFPDANEFWTESYISIVREIFMAQNVAINQMLINANKINNPQRAIDVGSILDETELRYKPNGKIRFKPDTNINSALQVLETPAIDTPLAVYETLENIVQLMSGVTGAVQGVAEEDKVGIYEGNISATSDRFNLLNKSYTNGYNQFAVLYKWGVQEHLKKKQAVRIIGPDGVEVHNVNYKDISPLQDYLVAVSSSTSESQTDAREKREKIQFLSQYLGTGLINDRNAFEMEAEIVGFNQSDIRRLTDAKNTYKSEIISEASRDIELIISGKKVQPNEIADLAYLQYISNYMRDKKENLSLKQFIALENYFQEVKPIAIRNIAYQVQDDVAERGGLQDGIQEIPEEETIDQPLEDIPMEETPMEDNQLLT